MTTSERVTRDVAFDGYTEIRIDGHLRVAYGPNPYGMMGQGWTRGWVFDLGGKQLGTIESPSKSSVAAWAEQQLQDLLNEEVT